MEYAKSVLHIDLYFLTSQLLDRTSKLHSHTFILNSSISHPLILIYLLNYLSKYPCIYLSIYHHPPTYPVSVHPNEYNFAQFLADFSARF